MAIIPPFSALSPGITVDASACDLDDLAPCGGVDVKVAGDLRWGELVRDNPEADGQTPAQTIASVRAWDRTEDRARSFAYAECGFTPGSSRFQEQLPGGEDRYEIREVSFLFVTGTKTTPIRDPELA